MKPLEIFRRCSTFIGIILLLVARKTHGKNYPYKKCSGNKLQLWLQGGECIAGSRCELLEGCTTFDGSIIIRPTYNINATPIKYANFPALREITGYLIILFFKEFQSMSNVFPNLAVIRGKSQILHYSLIIYKTLLERVILPSLTVIKSGGVRIDQNDQMCYIKTISWGSIVLDKGLTEENFGLTFYKNNKNCYDKCLTGSCYAPSGHGSARQQHCFGPGSRLKDNPQCQKLCKASCGARGCLEGTMDQCCHEECLGGCTVKGSNRHCHACMHYRSGPYGFCVSKCPPGMYVVGNFECQRKCPMDNLWFIAVKTRHYIYKGHCVRRCPAGYIGNSFTKHCDKCKTDRCPRECGTVGRVYKIDSLFRASELKGCTVVIGDIKIEIRAGQNDMVEKLEKILGSIERVAGYIEVRESEALTSLSFFKNLREIRPYGLLQNDLALLVFRNSNLKTLWNPKTLFVTKGRLLFHSNPYLCPNEIKTFEKTLQGNKSKAVTETKNGYLGECDLKKFNITVKEITDPKLCDPISYSKNKKCVEVTWNHLRSLDPRNVFYIINYRIISKDTKKVEKKDDSCGAIKWMQIDVNVPKIEVNSNQTTVHKGVLMKNSIRNLKPYALYAFFVETYVLDGEVRKSGIVEIRLSEAAPGRPLGLQAAFLSKSEIQVTWSPPDDPNGIITQYRIFYKPKEYSFWHSKLDWCSRDVTTQSSTDAMATSGKNSSSLGFCRRNVTCNCGPNAKVSRRVVEDRNFALFNRNLQDAIIFRLFSKTEDDSSENKSFSKKGTKKTDPVCDEEAIKKGKCKKPSNIKTIAPQTGKIQIQETTTTSSTETPVLPTLRPVDNYIKVSGDTFKYVIKNLHYFREYRIMVCPCNKVGCREVVCANTVGQTDADPYADSIPERVMVNVKDNAYNVSWIAPPSPNGIVLRYDIRTRHNQNQERLRCRLGHLPTTLIEVGAAPGNYSIRIRAITPASNGSTWTPYTYFKIEEKVAAAAPTSNNIVIGIGSGAAFLIILLLITIVYYIHVKKTAQMGVPGLLYASVNPEYLNSNEVYIPDEWEVPRDKIELIKELGKGSFGMVYEGIAYGIIEDEPKLRVAVKTVNENASIRDRSEFLQEASIMKAFNCNHIVRLLGVVSQEQPTLVVMELMEKGDLKTFLRCRRPEERGGLSPPKLAETLQMAAEIADGMSYLAARKFVHRDLAARNCMVAADFTVKIGDFGMTRDVYETDYYRKGGKGLLPVRWMAPESLRDGIFTTASDVWSYGVVLWEMATLAAQPYPGKSNEDVLRFVVEGGVLEQPDDCSDRLYNMMSNCWKTDPRARPSFLEIVQFLENDVSDAFEEVSYYYEMKRKLLEATETNLLKGPDTLNVNVNHVRQGSLKMNNLLEPNHRGSMSSASGAEDNWKTEADRSMKSGAEKPDGRSMSMYDNDGDAANVRYVELPQSNTKSKKKDGKPVPV